MSEVQAPWKQEELASDKVTKKQIVEFLQTNGNNDFLTKHALKGSVANVTKKAKKDDLSAAYQELFENKSFRTANDDVAAQQNKDSAATKAKDTAAAHHDQKEEKKVKVEVVYFSKTVIKPGDQSTFAKKGETVEIFYTGKLDDGTVFDTNAPVGAAKAKVAEPAKGAKDDKAADKKAVPEKGAAEKKGKTALPLKVQVGKGKLVRGFDEALTQISKGEKAKIVIPAEHGYGKKGKPEAKIPPNANLTFEVEVVDIY